MPRPKRRSRGVMIRSWGVVARAIVYLRPGTRIKILTQMSIRQRLSPEASRAGALEAARALLIEQGPQAGTLKAVAGRMGKSHANLLHHFGSAAGLQAALAGLISSRVCAGI